MIDAINCIMVFNINQQNAKSAWKRTFYGILDQCKQKHGKSLVYMTTNFELCISLPDSDAQISADHNCVHIRRPTYFTICAQVAHCTTLFSMQWHPHVNL